MTLRKPIVRQYVISLILSRLTTPVACSSPRLLVLHVLRRRPQQEPRISEYARGYQNDIHRIPDALRPVTPAQVQHVWAPRIYSA